MEIIFLNDRRKIMSYRVIEEDLTFSFFLHPFLHPQLVPHPNDNYTPLMGEE